MSHVRKGDTVVVLKGKYRGKRGVVLNVTNGRVVVEAVAVVKRHTKPNAANQAGGIVEKFAAINASNVALWDSKVEKPARARNVVRDGKKIRVSTKSDTVFVATK